MRCLIGGSRVAREAEGRRGGHLHCAFIRRHGRGRQAGKAGWGVQVPQVSGSWPCWGVSRDGLRSGGLACWLALGGRQSIWGHKTSEVKPSEMQKIKWSDSYNLFLKEASAGEGLEGGPG